MKTPPEFEPDSKLLPGRLIQPVFFAAGFYALILQTTLLREFLVVVLGNEFVLGISLFNWLVGIFIGAVAGGTCADRIVRKWKILAVSLLLLVLLSPLSVTLIRLLYPLSGSPPGAYISFFQVIWLSALLIAPLSFFIGFTFPLAARFDSGSAMNPVKKTIFISRVYIFEAGGALLGGLLASFVLAGRFNSYIILSLASLPLLALLAIVSRLSGHQKLFVTVCLLLGAELLWLTPLASTRFDRFMVERRWKGFSGSELVWNRDSRFQNLAIGKDREQLNLYANGQFSTSFPEDTDNLVLAAHLIVQHPDPKRILVIGEAISGLAEKLLQYDIREIKSLEIDRDLMAGIKKYLPARLESIFTDSRFSIRIEDGRKFAGGKNQENSGWDIVFVNVGEPSTLLLNRFYTREFFQDIASIESESGILCLRTTSSENYLSGIGSQYTASIYQTLRSVFPYLAVAPGDKNIFFAAKKAGVVSQSPRLLSERYIRSRARPEKLAKIFSSLYPREKTAFVNRALQSREATALNTDERPVSNFYFNKILGWASDSRTEGIFRFFEKITLFHLLICLSGLFVIRLAILVVKSARDFLTRDKTESDRFYNQFLRKTASSRFNILFAATAAGFSGLSMEMMVIYSFQHVFGYVYQLIGFIIALFMTGLPLGAHISNTMLMKKNFTGKKMIGFLALTQVLFAALALYFPVLLKQVGGLDRLGKGLMFLVMTITGALVGMVFPLALELIAKNHTRKMGRSAGIVDASDHLGASLGAIFCGGLLLPVLGTAGIGRLIASLSGFSLLFLFLQLVAGDKTAG
jgi:spermidine synthase